MSPEGQAASQRGDTAELQATDMCPQELGFGIAPAWVHVPLLVCLTLGNFLHPLSLSPLPVSWHENRNGSLRTK